MSLISREPLTVVSTLKYFVLEILTAVLMAGILSVLKYFVYFRHQLCITTLEFEKITFWNYVVNSIQCGKFFEELKESRIFISGSKILSYERKLEIRIVITAFWRWREQNKDIFWLYVDINTLLIFRTFLHRRSCDWKNIIYKNMTCTNNHIINDYN